MLEEENTYHAIQKLVVLISVTEPVRQSTPLEKKFVLRPCSAQESSNSPEFP